MKKIALLSTLLLLCISFSWAQSPNEKKAKAILDKVSEVYRNYTTMEADFSIHMENKKDGINEKQEGKLFTKGEKYCLNMDNRKIISNGTTVWNIMTDIFEVTINNASNDEDAINPTSIFTIWETGHKQKFIKEQVQNNQSVHIIDLSPIKGKAYYKIRLVIDKSKKQLLSATVYEKNGTTYTYMIENFVPNKAIADSKFSFNEKDYPDADIIDMR